MLLFALAVALQDPLPLAGKSTRPIELVEISPLFNQFYACTEHPAGDLPYLGDDLGTDCWIQAGITRNEGFLHPFRTDGKSNEDWYGWGADVLAPFEGVIEKVHVNEVVNIPGTLGKGPASMIFFARSDGTKLYYAHLDDIHVKVGDRVAAGQVVGTVGNNGFSRSPHIHVGAWRGDQPLQIRWDLRALARLLKLPQK